jgi:3,4-dihydroxy 2-butanone 4-phosphate synthase/GTP cyclohydrolase II
MSDSLSSAARIVRDSSARLPTIFGEFVMTLYREDGAKDTKDHVCLRMGDTAGPPPLVRIHSECLTGDVFGSVRCDCGEQLLAALEAIAKEGRGVVVYLRQEGRGIGLSNKLQAYALQDKGLDTVDANLHLGLPVDDRDYSVAAAMLADQGVKQVRLLTNNPKKISGLEIGRIEVVERVPLTINPRPENQYYLKTKEDKLGHLLGNASELVIP